MKKMTLFAVMLFCYGISFAQTYTGRVVTPNNEPLAYANVIAKANQQLLVGALTNEDGTFELDVETENPFRIEIGYVGYQTTIVEPTTQQLGIITLQADNSIEEVVVIAQQQVIEQQADRLVFNIENSPTASGGDALDALKITPGVNVSDDNIAIFGKGTVQVMINDRLVQMKGEELVAYLGTIASDDIQKIEVITTPPAKYDAEGNSGLINIQLKQPKEGSWNNRVRVGYIDTSYPAVNYGNTFTYNNGKLSSVVSVNGKQGHEGQLLRANVYYPNGPWLSTTKFKEDQSYTNTRVSIDYNISETTTIGGSYNGNFRNNNDSDHTVTSIFNDSNQQIGTINADGTDETNKTYHTANLHLVQQIGSLGKELSFDADYFTFDRSQNRIFENTQIDYNPMYSKADNIASQGIKNKSAQIHMSHPTKAFQLSYGAKYTSTTSENDILLYDITTSERILDTNQSNEFEYQENVGAVYADVTKTFGEQWQAKVGLRGEQTTTEGVSKTLKETNKNEYTKLFPTAFLAYQINENNSANFTYNKRINRPGFWALNPFRWYINQNSYAEGNPFLQPSISNNFEMQHVYKGALISKVFYSNKNNNYGEFTRVNATTNQLAVRRENFYNEDSFGLQETLVINPTKRWNTTTQVSVSSTIPKLRNGFSEAKVNKGTNFQIYTNNNISLSNKNSLKAEVTGYYSTPQYVQLFKTDDIYFVDLGLSAKFLENKLSVNAAVKDIFKSAAPTVSANTNNINQTYFNYNDNQYWKVNLSYSFGNNKIRAKNRASSNKDEQNRANQ